MTSRDERGVLDRVRLPNPRVVVVRTVDLEDEDATVAQAYGEIHPAGPVGSLDHHLALELPEPDAAHKPRDVDLGLRIRSVSRVGEHRAKQRPVPHGSGALEHVQDLVRRSQPLLHYREHEPARRAGVTRARGGIHRGARGGCAPRPRPGQEIAVVEMPRLTHGESGQRRGQAAMRNHQAHVLALPPA